MSLRPPASRKQAKANGSHRLAHVLTCGTKLCSTPVISGTFDDLDGGVRGLVLARNRKVIEPHHVHLRRPGLFRVANSDGSFSLQYDALPTRDTWRPGDDVDQAGSLVFEYPADSKISTRLKQGRLGSMFASATNPRMDGPRQGVFNLTNGAIRMVDVIPAASRPLTLMLEELLQEAAFRDMLQALRDAMKKEENTWASKERSVLLFYSDVTRPALDRLLARGLERG